MNFSSYNYFWNYNYHIELFVPKGYLPYATDIWAMATSAATVALTESKSLTGPRDDVITSRSSQIKFKSVDSLQIGASGGVESIQDIKAVQVVVAPLPIGHRNIASGVPERRCVQVTAAEMLQTEVEVIEDTGRTGSSPRSC
jgi:hypothetical protein